MISNDPSPAASTDAEVRRGTLPPPEWKQPAGASPVRHAPTVRGLARRTGPRAEEAWLRGRVEAARASEDAEAFREYGIRLARWLASRDRDLLEAADLASLALGFGEDVELRREVSSWLESLGEFARAAAALRPIAALPDLDSTEAAYLMVRAGLLKARAGAPAAAAVAFETAMSIDPSDPQAAQLFGGMWTSDSDAVDPAAAAEAYGEAARRHRLLRRTDAEIEDLWRAFATDPTNDEAASALADLLEGQGRLGAAGEVRRASSAAPGQDPERAARQVSHRLAAAAAARDVLGVLAAVLDAGFDAILEGDDANTFDAALLDVGLLETVAARLEMRAERAAEAGDPGGQAAHLVELARLCAGPLADPERAVGAWISAFAADPANEDALVSLRGLLGPGERTLGVSLGVRGDPLRTLAQRVAPLATARERRDALVADLGRVMPDLGKEPPLSDDGSNSRAATARAWVAASLAHDGGETARALERVAVSTAPPLRSVILATAARRYLALGRPRDARRAAEASARADPGSARGLASLADAVLGDGDRIAAGALEGAIAAVGPRAEWCGALVDALESLGEAARLVGARQQWVALRPGDRIAIERLLVAAAAAPDAPRLAETLAWLFSQPQAASWAGGAIGQALRALSELDPAGAAVLARRALDVFGPRVTSLRVAMLVVADRASDDAFAATILERWLPFCPESPERVAIHLRLAALRHALGDAEGEARGLLRALRAGASPSSVEAALGELVRGMPASSDAEVWTAMAEAERLTPGRDRAEAAWAWRDLGGALWDLADDRAAAVAAWERAVQFAPADGPATLALDLLAFGGLDFTRDYLFRLVESESDDRSAAKIASDVGRAVFTAGERHLAFDLAARGVTRCPTRADVLELAEQAAEGAADRIVLSGLYDLVGQRALGRFGRRAAHYRGARLFDRTGERELALKHAAQAFYAVPSEGSSFHLLARAAERAGDRTQAARTVEQVAQAAVRPEARAAWLMRAASILGAGEEATRRKVEMLLAAAVGAPSVPTVALLREAVRSQLRLVPEEKEILEMRFGRAANAVVGHIEGPDGARVAIAFATSVMDLFADADAAMALFEKAFGTDADIDEFAALDPYGAALAGARNVRDRLATMLATAEGPFGNVGIAALRTLASVAAATGAVALEARAVVAAAMREPDSDDLVIAADAATCSLPELGERLATKVTPARRVQALLARAHVRVGEGAHDQAAPLFERAAGLAEESEREDIERALRVALDAAGHSAELEERVRREASSDVAPAAQRADRWVEIAERREGRGDRLGAMRALVEATRLDPQPLERWSALERVAEAVGDDAVRVEALQHIAERVKPEGRGAVYKRLARAQERMNDSAGAATTWGRVLALDEHDDEADHSLEAVMAAAGRYAELVDHLAARAERMRQRSAPVEMLRAVRLRRAAILEQRLGRDEDARDELTLLLGESPDNAGALRYLADLLERTSNFARSAPLWRRAATLEADRTERSELEMRAAAAYLSAGDPAMALAHAKSVLVADAGRRDARKMAVEASRALGSDAELGEALEASAAFEEDHAARSLLLVEAAQAAARAGDAPRALEWARRAAETAPDRATAQLLARGLEYRLRGAGTRDDARLTIHQLGRVAEPLARSDAALRAFLVAEAIDAADGPGAGTGELARTRDAIGAHPLLAIGLAERLAVRGDHVAAVDEYLAAIDGPLLELRRPGAVALAAADSALQSGRLAEAKLFIDRAERDLQGSPGVEARRALLAERERPVARPATVPPPRASAPPGAGSLEHLEAAVRKATSPGERARARLVLGRARLGLGDARAAEPLLWEALADGLVEAGDVLSPLVAAGRDRAPDLVRLRRQQVMLEPGEPRRLQALREAALADDDRVYARAVEHVLRAFDPGAGPLPPPPLSHQPEQAGVFALLVRPSLDAAGEALSVLWEGANQLFVREAVSYGITGVERVVPGPTSVIARLYEVATRLLGTARVPLFLARSTSGPPTAVVALLSPPSVVLSGDAREESAALRFILGRAMAAAMPHNVLRLGLSARDGRALVEALRAAFGSPEIGRRVDAQAARMAESFWQVVPARAQRRLQELLGAGGSAEYEDLVGRAHQSGRRVGMFLAGDFAYAARAVIVETAPHLERSLSTQNLSAMCDELPALADLVRLAVSREYADARWHVVAPPMQRGSVPSGRFSLF